METHLVECDGQLFLVSVRDDDMGGLAVDEGGGKGGGDASAVEVHRVEWLWDGRVLLVRETDLGRNALWPLDSFLMLRMVQPLKLQSL